MNRPRHIALVLGVLLLLVAIKLWRPGQTRPTNAAHPVTDTRQAPASDSTTPVAVGQSDTSEPPWGKANDRKLKPGAPRQNPEAGSQELETPPREELASAVVKTRMKSGETLVTGGYQTPDGRYEVTLITPTPIRREGEQSLLTFSAKVITLEKSSIEESGLGSLITETRASQQHGEVWAPGENEAFSAKLSTVAGADILSSPTVMVAAGEWGTVELMGTDFNFYNLHLKGTPTDDGSFDIESKVVRGKELPPNHP